MDLLLHSSSVVRGHLDPLYIPTCSEIQDISFDFDALKELYHGSQVVEVIP